MFDTAIIGLGFSGNLVLFNLVIKLNKPAKILISDPSDMAFKGIAYSTMREEHLLNVRAKNMGALKDNVGHFYTWLQKRGYDYDQDDFVPRMIYGRYLEDIKKEAFLIAEKKNIQIEFVKSKALKTEKKNNSYIISFENGDKYQAKTVVLATGNQVRENPWQFDFSKFKNVNRAQPIVVVGSGLTAVDTIISIFRSGYRGDVHCISRKNLFPMPHVDKESDQKINISGSIDLLLKMRPSQIFHMLKNIIRGQKNLPWQSVFDSLRPYHQKIWKNLTVEQQKLVLGKYFTLWGVHRHRMARRIDVEIKYYMNDERLKLIKGDYSEKDKIDAFHVFDCRGLSLKILDDIFSTVEGLQYAPNGYGITCDDNYIINGNSSAPICAIGSCFAGYLFETIAVPELRVQADVIADSIAKLL